MAKEEKKQDNAKGAEKKAPKKKKVKSILFILIPPANGRLSKGRVFVSQHHAEIVNGVQVKNERTDSLAPDAIGVFSLPENNPNHEARLQAMEDFMERNNAGQEYPFILGPFEDRAEAVEAMHEARPKSDAEKASDLETVNQELEDENAELKRKLAEAEAKINS